MARIDFSVRQMTEADLRGVAEVEAGVFTDWYRVHRRDPAPLPERTLRELHYASSRDPEGNFVAIATDGSLAGFVFSRTWGRVGWFGTFGVPTQLQGLGVGRALVDRTVDHLLSRASVVGLETMPESGANIGLYAKAGFVATHPTIVLELSLIHEVDRLKGLGPDDVLAWGTQEDGARTRMLDEMREISDAHLTGLDYAPEIEGIREHGFGETFLSTGPGGRVDGFAVLRTEPFRSEGTSGRAYLHILATAPGSDAAAVVPHLLRAVWTRATSIGLSSVVTGVSARYHCALRLLLASGFKVRRAAIRMVEQTAAPDIFKPSVGINVSRWAG